MGGMKFDISMSLDGYVAGPNQGPDNGLGDGGEQLHEWVVELAAWRESHGREGGEVNASTPSLERALENLGALVMGRNMFGGHGPWEENPWDGWWGPEPPFHAPVFVVTHHPREPLEREGGTTFHFVTDGVEAAYERARDAAGERDVRLGGGADVAQQCLRAGLIDEMELHVVPVLLGAGERLFEGLGDAGIELTLLETIDAPGVSHLRYRVG